MTGIRDVKFDKTSNDFIEEFHKTDKLLEVTEACIEQGIPESTCGCAIHEALAVHGYHSHINFEAIIIEANGEENDAWYRCSKGLRRWQDSFIHNGTGYPISICFDAKHSVAFIANDDWSDCPCCEV